MPLYVGINQTNITPPPGVWMSGYAARVEPAIGVHDELHARAFVFDNGHCRAALVSADIIAFSPGLVQSIREQIQRRCDIGAHNIMLSATHTHSGPHIGVYNEAGPLDGPYLDILVRKIVGAVEQATQEMRPSILIYGESSAQIGINRRPAFLGATFGAPNFAGAVSTLVQVLCINSIEGRLRAVLFSHPCHPTTTLSSNLFISADWPGAAAAHLRGKLQGDGSDESVSDALVTAFLQGCAGDIDPYSRGSWEAVTANGKVVAAAAHTARWNAHGRLEDTLSSTSLAVELTVDHDSKETDTGNNMPTTAVLELQCLNLGGIRILGIPAEPFVSYQSMLGELSTTPVLTLGYTNGCRNYLPTSKDFPFGGYEITDAHKFYGQPMYTAECEAEIMSACSRLLKQS